jgi:hypothetical protein
MDDAIKFFVIVNDFSLAEVESGSEGPSAKLRGPCQSHSNPKHKVPSGCRESLSLPQR